MNIKKHTFTHSIQDRAFIKKQKPLIIWLTGLSGSGKSTLADEIEKKLLEISYHTFILDGDNTRLGINSDLSFSDIDRAENIRRVSEIAKLFLDSGLIVITSFISPFRKDREMARNKVDKDEFIEVYLNAPLYLCEQRDPKGLYKKAYNGEISNFTGIDSPYEPPLTPEIELDMLTMSLNNCVNTVLEYLVIKGYLKNEF